MMGGAYPRAAAAVCAVAAPLCLCGCFGLSDRLVSDGGSADVAAVEVPVAAGTAPPIRTVRHSRGGVDDREPADREAGIPSPSGIFDFHPPGSKAETWRQPFVIDPNDGPLSGYVRRMDAELAASNRQVGTAARQAEGRKTVCPSTGPVGTISARCGENAVARP